MKPMPSRQGRRGQRGVVLFVALIVLIVMTLAGLALLRQMGAGTSIAGNLAFKENATFVADRGAEVALQYIQAVATDLTVNTPASGYAATCFLLARFFNRSALLRLMMPFLAALSTTEQ